MKALITSAGRGTRIPIAAHTNKGLLRVGNKSLIRRSIDSLQKHGVDDIYIVTGHCANKVEKAVGSDAQYIFNPLYKTSGIIVSIQAAKSQLYGEKFIFLTNDLLYNHKLISESLKVRGDIVIPFEKKSSYKKEDSKVSVRNNKVLRMGKDLPPKKTSGEYAHMTIFSRQGSKYLFDKIDSFVKQGRLNVYLMDVFNELIKDGVELHALDITGVPRIEIDYLRDLHEARRKIFPLIKNYES